MRGALLVAVLVGLTAACAPLSPTVRALADQGEASVLICNGFVVPAGQLLRVDDMSVDCVIASEVFDQQEFIKAGVETTALLRIVYPTNGLRSSAWGESGRVAASARFVASGIRRTAFSRESHVFLHAGR